MKRSPVLRFLRDEDRLRTHFRAAGLDGERSLHVLLGELARVARAEQQRLEPIPLDQTGETRAALEEVRRRLKQKTKSELKTIADATRTPERPGVHVRTLKRIRAGRYVPRLETLERLARELDIEFEAIAYKPPEVTGDDIEFANAVVQWGTAEWMREQNERALAGEPLTMLVLGEPPTPLALRELGLPDDVDGCHGLLQQLSAENVQEWRSQHPDRWDEPPYSKARVRVWKYRAAHVLESD